MKTMKYGMEYLKHFRNHDSDMYTALKQSARDFLADEIDIAECLYWYCSDWHNGQFSDLYRCLSSNPFRPSILENSISTDSVAYEIQKTLIQAGTQK